MQVGAPSANPSGGLAFGYTFTLTDNFTAAAEKIALSFQTMEKAAITSAARVSASISQIVGSSKGLSQTTNEVNKLTTAYNRLAMAKTAAQTRVPTQVTQNRLQAQLQNSNTTLGNSTARAQAATIAQTTMLTNAQNAQATSAIRGQTAQVAAQNRLQNALRRTGQVGRQSGEMIDHTLGSVMRGLGTMFLGASLFKPLLYAIDVNDEFERAQVRLKGLLGSDSAAKSVLKDVKMDAKNDFLLNSKDLLMSNASIISQGGSIDFARNMSNDISTLTQVGGGSVQGFANAIKGISRILGSGKVNARQVGRLETGGANIAIAKYAKEFLNKSLFTSRGSVNISADEFYKMISLAAQKYKPIAEEMRNTVTGLKSMVSEGTTYIMAEFGKINAIIYKKLLRGLDAFLTKLMIFSQTPIGNVVVKLVSAALAVAAIATTALGLYQVVKALTAAFAPLIFYFFRTVIVGYAIYKMLQSNSSAFLALGIGISMVMGTTMTLTAIVMVLWRAWQTFNAVTAESYQKMSPLNQMFARWGGYLEAFGEILSTINGDTYLLSESLVMKLKSIGAFETVLKIGDAMLKIYNGFVKIYEIGKWVAGLFDGWGAYAIIFGMFSFKIFGLQNNLIVLGAVIKPLIALLVAFAQSMSYAFSGAALWAVIHAAQQLYSTYDNWKGFGTQLAPYNDPSQKGIKGNALGYPINYGNAKDDRGSFIPNSFDPSTDPTTRVRSLQYQTIGSSNEGSISSAQGQDINVNVHYDGELIYRDMVKKRGLENARSNYSYNGLGS